MYYPEARNPFQRINATRESRPVEDKRRLNRKLITFNSALRVILSSDRKIPNDKNQISDDIDKGETFSHVDIYQIKQIALRVCARNHAPTIP